MGSPRAKAASQLGARNPHGLIGQRDQVHLDAALARVPDGAVGEGREVEVGAELAVDAHEQVLVERGRHAERVVVGEQQLALGLDEVGAEEQRVARPAATPRIPAQERVAPRRRSKLPMLEPRKSDEQRPARRPLRGRVAKALRRRWRDARRPRRARAAPSVRSEQLERVGARCRSGARARACAGRRRLSASSASFSPLPQPSSTKVIGSSSGPTISGAKRASSRALGARDAVPGQPRRWPRRAPSRGRRRGTSTGSCFGLERQVAAHVRGEVADRLRRTAPAALTRDSRGATVRNVA